MKKYTIVNGVKVKTAEYLESVVEKADKNDSNFLRVVAFIQGRYQRVGSFPNKEEIIEKFGKDYYKDEAIACASQMLLGDLKKHAPKAYRLLKLNNFRDI